VQIGRQINLAIANLIGLVSSDASLKAIQKRQMRERSQGRLARSQLGFRRFSEVEISDVSSAYKDMLSKWQHVPVGGKLHSNW